MERLLYDRHHGLEAKGYFKRLNATCKLRDSVLTQGCEPDGKEIEFNSTIMESEGLDKFRDLEVDKLFVDHSLAIPQENPSSMDWLPGVSIDAIVFTGQEIITLGEKTIFNDCSLLDNFHTKAGHIEFFASKRKMVKFVWSLEDFVIVGFDLNFYIVPRMVCGFLYS